MLIDVYVNVNWSRGAAAYDRRMPAFDVVDQPSGRTFAVAEGETVLAAAVRAGVDLPSSCRTGTCRTCMRRLLAGDVTYTVEWPGLTPDEKPDWVLPCVARPASPLTLGESAQRPWWT